MNSRFLLSVLNDTQNEVASQIVVEDGKNVLVFQAANTPAAGFKTLFIEHTGKIRPVTTFKPALAGDNVIENKQLKIVFDGETGRLIQMEDKTSGVKAIIEQNFYWYNSSAGNNVNSSQPSGACMCSH